MSSKKKPKQSDTFIESRVVTDQSVAREAALVLCIQVFPEHWVLSVTEWLPFIDRVTATIEEAIAKARGVTPDAVIREDS